MKRSNPSTGPEYVANGKILERHHPDGTIEVLGKSDKASITQAGARFWSVLPPTPTLRRAINAWLDEYVDKELGPTARKEYRDVMECVVFPKQPTTNPKAFTRTEARRFRQSLIDSGMHIAQVTVVMRTLSAFFGKAKTWGLVPQNPIPGANDPGIGRKPKA